MSDAREIPAQDQATREYLRILDLVAFNVEGYKKANHNQHGTRYHFEDGSWLSISDTNKTASTMYRTGQLAWHPNRKASLLRSNEMS